MAWCLVKHRDKFPFTLPLLDGSEWSASRSGRLIPGKRDPVPIVSAFFQLPNKENFELILKHERAASRTEDLQQNSVLMSDIIRVIK
jgi:hypothetical protein